MNEMAQHPADTAPLMSGEHKHVTRQISQQDEVLLEQQRHPQFRVYKRRWFMLLVLCVLNFANAMIWISFAPVADYAASFYHTSLTGINWLSIIFLVVCMFFGLGASWILDSWGLRAGVLAGAWLNAIGAAIRIIGSQTFVPTTYRFAIVMVGQGFASFAQPFVLNSPTKLAALWFAANERATANMFASLANPLGVLVANAAAPLIVGTDESKIALMVAIFALPAFLGVLMATFGFCNSIPPTHPTMSAAAVSEPFFAGLKLVLKNKSYVVLMIAFGCGIGLFSCLSTLLEQIICPHGYSDTYAGIAGAVLIGAGLVGGAMTGWYVDQTKKFEATAKVCYGFAAIACIFFALASRQPDHLTEVLITSGVFGFFAFSLMPVCLELGVECTYPVAEATSAGLQWIFGQFFGILLIIVCQALAQNKTERQLPHSKCKESDEQNGEIQDLTYAMYGMAVLSAVVAILFICAFTPSYRRLVAERKYAAESILRVNSQQGNARLTSPPLSDNRTDNKAMQD